MVADPPYSESGLHAEMCRMDGTQFHLWLQHQLQQTLLGLTVIRDEPGMRQAQGKAQLLREIDELITSSYQREMENKDRERRREEQRQFHRRVF